MGLLTHAALEPSREVETPFPDSRWVVLKFGGRSVATAENWARIAEILRSRLEENLRPVVCHSALAGVSNALIELLELAERDQDTSGLLAEIVAQHRALAADLGVNTFAIRGSESAPGSGSKRLSRRHASILGASLPGCRVAVSRRYRCRAGRSPG